MKKLKDVQINYKIIVLIAKTYINYFQINAMQQLIFAKLNLWMIALNVILVILKLEKSANWPLITVKFKKMMFVKLVILIM